MNAFQRLVVLFLAFSASVKSQSQPFAKFFNFGAGNPFANVSFINSHELRDSTGYLILADRYTSYRSGVLIKTDTNLTETWSMVLNFQQSAPPFDNINFLDVGEFPNGNYFVLGMAGPGGTAPHYVLFVFDTSGQVINHVAVHDSQNLTNGGNAAQIHFGLDSSVILAFSEYERFGYYRFDQHLNLLSSGFYTSSTPWGRDCIMTRDTTLVMTSADGLTKTSLNGNVLWSKSYGFGSHLTTLYESPSGFLYTGGISTNPSLATFAKYDANGNPLFLREYKMIPATGMSAIWNIYPCDDHLMLFSDSVIMVADTNGVIIGMGKTMNTYNYKNLKPTLSDNYLVTGQIFQDSLMNYAYTLMKFDDSTVSGCLHPRAIQTINSTITAQSQSPLPMIVNIVIDTIHFAVNAANLNYDALNGCPPSPLSVSESSSFENDAQLFPNPASQSFIYSLPSEGAGIGKLQLYNSMGQLVLSVAPSRTTTITVSVAHLAEGLYYLQYTEAGIVKDSQSILIAR